MDIVTATRVAAFALNTMTSQMGLGNLAVHFDGESLDEWAILLPEVRALKASRSVAFLELTEATRSGQPVVEVYIVIPDLYNLVRDKHLSEFDPQQYGLHPNYAKDWKGDKAHDLEVEWTVGLDEIRQGPPRPLYKSQMGSNRVRVVKSI